METTNLERLKRLVKAGGTLYLLQRGRTRKGGEYVSAFVIVKAAGYEPFIKCIDQEIADALQIEAPYDKEREGFFLRHGQTAAARIVAPVNTAVFGLAEGCPSEWL